MNNQIDIFCDIIDNFGDVGVIYRFAKQLYKQNNLFKIRIILNKFEELNLINPEIDMNQDFQICNNITYINIKSCDFENISPSPIIIEAFGCDIPETYLNKIINKTLIINLEYLSAENWTKDYHLKESLNGNPLIRKFFFMPGFSVDTGGLILDEDFLFYKKNKDRSFIKKITNLDIDNKIIGTIFTYENNFNSLILSLQNREEKYLLILFGSKTHFSFNEIKKTFIKKSENYFIQKNIEILFCDFLSQNDYDKLMLNCDFNFVRGEESLVRASLSGLPFLWHAYLQDDYTHMDKVSAFSKLYCKHSINKIIIDNYQNLIYNYNYRSTNSLENNNICYNSFFENINELKNMSISFSNYLINNCNLIENMLNFIKVQI